MPEFEKRGRQYLTFDDSGVLAAAKRDPNEFIAGLTAQVTLDEVQQAPELFPAISWPLIASANRGAFCSRAR